MGHYFWYFGIVLFTIITALQHYVIYTDNLKREDFRDKNILSGFIFFVYKSAYCELLAVGGWIFVIYYVLICLTASLIWDIWFNTSCWYRTRHCHDENKEYELELDSTIPAEELIRACGIQRLLVDICELAELINDTEIKGRAIVRLIKMEELMTFPNRLKLLDSRGLKPADPIHLLAFAQKFPDIWKEVRLYAFGTPGKRSPNEKSFLKLSCAHDVKSLCWTTPDNVCLSANYFGRILAVPKD